MTITLEAIKAEHEKVAEMIAKFEAQSNNYFEYQGERIQLNDGERHFATIIAADRKCHVILLPGEMESVTWNDAIVWAKEQGGELPDRVESALLFATMKDEFKPNWYWTRAQHVSGSGYAWGQLFGHGYQGCSDVDDEFRARAVRRLSF